jgi:hypothetical protein
MFDILLVYGAFAGAVIATIVAHIINNKLRRKSDVLHIAKMEIEIQRILEDCVFKTFIDRALLLKLHNGGDKLSIGSKKYFSILHEAHTPRVQVVKDLFQEIETDPDYYELILYLSKIGKKFFKTKDLPNSLLKRRYQKDNIYGGIIVKVYDTKKGFYYASFVTTNKFDDLVQSEHYPLIEMDVLRLKKVFKKAAKLKILH